MRKRLWYGAGWSLEWFCDRTHWITHHRPWLWLFPYCPFARWAFWCYDRGDGK